MQSFITRFPPDKACMGVTIKGKEEHRPVFENTSLDPVSASASAVHLQCMAEGIKLDGSNV